MIQTFTQVFLFSNTFITLFNSLFMNCTSYFFLFFSIVVMAISSAVRCILSGLQTLKIRYIEYCKNNVDLF